MAADAAGESLLGGDDGAGDAGGAGDGGKPGAAGGAGAGGKSGEGVAGNGGGDPPGKADEGDLLGDEPKKPDEKKADEAPADIKIEVPKGLEAFADKAALEEFTKLAKEHKLSPEQANAVAKQAIERAKAHSEAVTKKLDDQSTEWFNEIKNDKEIGGENIAATKQDIALAIAKYAPAGFVAASKAFKLNSWPPLMRMLQAIGKDLRPDGGKIHGAKGGNAQAESHDQMLGRFYGTE